MANEEPPKKDFENWIRFEDTPPGQNPEFDFPPVVSSFEPFPEEEDPGWLAQFSDDPSVANEDGGTGHVEAEAGRFSNAQRSLKDISLKLQEQARDSSYGNLTSVTGVGNAATEAVFWRFFLKEERDIALRMHTKIATEHGISEDVATTGWVQSTLGTLKEALSRSDLPVQRSVPWHVYLINSDSVNAFATAYGHVYVTTTMCEKLKKEPNADAMLAMVIGHEMGHIIKHHVAKDVLQTNAAGHIISSLVGNINSLPGALLASFALTSAYVVVSRLPRSRRHEMEADKVAITLLGLGNYDRLAAPELFDWLMETVEPPMDQEEPSVLGNMLRTHPPTQERKDAMLAEVSYTENSKFDKALSGTKQVLEGTRRLSKLWKK